MRRNATTNKRKKSDHQSNTFILRLLSGGVTAHGQICGCCGCRFHGVGGDDGVRLDAFVLLIYS